jgi:hypothetical protein
MVVQQRCGPDASHASGCHILRHRHDFYLPGIEVGQGDPGIEKSLYE